MVLREVIMSFFEAPVRLTDLEFTDKFLELNLILVPGRAFSHKQNNVRLSFGAKMSGVQAGLKILTDAISMLKYKHE
jgi:hypothetical protein